MKLHSQQRIAISLNVLPENLMEQMVEAPIRKNALLDLFHFKQNKADY